MYLKNFDIFANVHDGFATFRDSAFQMRVFFFDFFQLSFALLKFRLKIHVDQIVIVFFCDYLSKIRGWKKLEIEDYFSMSSFSKLSTSVSLDILLICLWTSWSASMMNFCFSSSIAMLFGAIEDGILNFSEYSRSEFAAVLYSISTSPIFAFARLILTSKKS